MFELHYDVCCFNLIFAKNLYNDIMETLENKCEMFYPHVSVDCVLLGTNDDKLCVLLVERQVAGSNEKHYKLPGSLIYESEDFGYGRLSCLE